MNSDTFTQLIQKGFRVTLGATASLIEILQDPQRRQENLAKLKTELDQLSQEWAAKGEVTEQEARNFVDTIWTQRGGTGPEPGPGGSTSATMTRPAAPATSPDVQTDLQELTAQIAAIRTELESLRDDSSPQS